MCLRLSSGSSTCYPFYLCTEMYYLVSVSKAYRLYLKTVIKHVNYSKTLMPSDGFEKYLFHESNFSGMIYKLTAVQWPMAMQADEILQ